MDTLSIQSARLPGVLHRCFAVSFGWDTPSHSGHRQITDPHSSSRAFRGHTYIPDLYDDLPVQPQQYSLYGDLQVKSHVKIARSTC